MFLTCKLPVGIDTYRMMVFVHKCQVLIRAWMLAVVDAVLCLFHWWFTDAYDCGNSLFKQCCWVFIVSQFIYYLILRGTDFSVIQMILGCTLICVAQSFLKFGYHRYCKYILEQHFNVHIYRRKVERNFSALFTVIPTKSALNSVVCGIKLFCLHCVPLFSGRYSTLFFVQHPVYVYIFAYAFSNFQSKIKASLLIAHMVCVAQ